MSRIWGALRLGRIPTIRPKQKWVEWEEPWSKDQRDVSMRLRLRLDDALRVWRDAHPSVSYPSDAEVLDDMLMIYHGRIVEDDS